ncbi:MAG: PfkB family carbohydrate kinase [Thermodesulfovibrionales bacterium]|nr:PfkB family carbohydrate kinase [Thermodesulfovibrionales bacterium]
MISGLWKDVSVMGIGALNMDYLFRVDEFLADGETFVQEFYKSPGGSAANTVSILSQLSIPCSFFGVLGNDDDGDLIEESLKRKGVRLCINRVKGQTGKAFVFVDGLGRRSIYVLPGVNLCLEEIDYPTEGDFQLVHVTSLAGERAFKRQMEWVLKLSGDIRVSFSPGMLYVKYGLEILEPILRRSSILFLNKDELELLTPSMDLESAIKKIHGLGPEFISVTLGREGAILSLKEELHYQRSLAEKVIDTTGAGDAFSAGVLYGLIKGFDLKKCGVAGSYLSSKVLKTWGAQIEITEKELEDFIGV